MIGALFIVSGYEKLIGPYQNFQYVVESYEIMNLAMAELVARSLPWAELLLGVFITVGLWLHLSLRMLMVLIIMFMAVVGQAMVRNLPITECGCFGELMSFPLHVVLMFDGLLLIITGLLAKKDDRTSVLSLDRLFV